MDDDSLAILRSVPGFDAPLVGMPLDVIGLRTRVVTANCDAGQEMVILANATAGQITVTLPPVDGQAGRTYYVKKTDASANTVIIDGTAAETIDGVITFTLFAQYNWVLVVCDGLAWHILTRYETVNSHVTGGNNHDHAGGDGAQIDHAGLANLTTGDPHTQYLQAADLPGAGVSSLTINTDIDTEGDGAYADCAGTASITIAVTCTLNIIASFEHSTSNSDHASAVKLVNAADATLGTIIRQTNSTSYVFSQIMARVTGVAAGTYTCNLMHIIGNAASESHVKNKQIRIEATPE